MANNQYVNKVEYGNDTLIDISDTTAEAGEVLNNKVFYAKSGARSVGTLGTMTGATAQDNGAMGLVPAPTTSDVSKFLCGDGTWATPVNTTYSVFTQSGNSAAAGLVPAPSTTAGTTAFLCEDGTWKIPYSVMTGATSNANGASGLVPAPTSADIDKFLAGDGTYKSGGLPMVILSYGNSTWADFEAAYSNNVIVYCRASSNANPKTGSQTRMAFMAYVNDATTPTNVEFQYYRSMNSHSSTAMGDQVFVYKLDKTSGWSVTTRDASIKQITGSGITVGWNSNVVTLTNDVTISDSLTDTSTTKALSAAKGKALNDSLSGKLDTNQGSTNSGKFMKVDSDGTLTPDNVPNPSTMTGASSNAVGTSGLVPAPSAGDQDKVLKGDGTWGTIGTLPSVSSADNGKALEVVSGAWATGNEKIDKTYQETVNFSAKTWSGLTGFSGSQIWTDGTNIYYSYSSDNYVLDKSTSTWSQKTWNGLPSGFDPSDIWTDGTNIYYSVSTYVQYVLDKSTSTWSTKTWSGLTNFTGNNIWTDGDNIYYSNSSYQYILNKSTSKWTSKTWSGNRYIYGELIWTDGDNIYYYDSSFDSHYVLNKSTSTWSQKTWYGLDQMSSTFNPVYIWTDGTNIYYSRYYDQYILNKSTSTWESIEVEGFTDSIMYGSNIWTDGDNIYYNDDYSSRVYNKKYYTLFGSDGLFAPMEIADFKETLEIDDKIDKSDIVNNLTTNDATKVLSAAKGKELQDTIGSTAMGTTATTLTGAISELSDHMFNNDWTAITGISTKYTINDTYQTPSRYVVRSGFLWMCFVITCVTPTTSWEVVANIPTILLGATNYSTVPVGLPMDGSGTDTTFQVLAQSGKLYCRNGVAGHNYYISFCYPYIRD